MQNPLPTIRRLFRRGAAPIALAALLASFVLHTHAQPRGKTPAPAEIDQRKSRDLLADVFGDDLAKPANSAAKLKLASTLLQQGRDVKDDPTLRFVLFDAAKQLAASAGDASVVLQAVEEIQKSFEVDALLLKADALAVVVAATIDKDASQSLAETLQPFINEAVDLDHYKAAQQFAKLAITAANQAENKSLVKDIQKRAEEVRGIERDFQRMVGFLDRLKVQANDGEANLELGRYFGLQKRQWDKALPFLAKGSAKELSEQARRDMARPAATPDQLLVADGWWELAQAEKDPTKLALQARAAFWYEKALLQTAGLSRVKAQKRIEIVAERASGLTATATSVQAGELKKFEGNGDEIKGVAFSPDGRYAAAAGIDQTVRIYDLASGKEEKVLRGHTKQVWSVVFHPNSRQIYSASWDATVRLWDVKSGSELKRFTHAKDVNGVALSRDGGLMLAGCDDQNAYLWNPQSGDEIRRFPGHDNYVYSVAFANDGKHVATGSVDKSVRVHDLSNGQLVRAIKGFNCPVGSVAFSADSRYVVGSGDNVVRLYDIATGNEARRFEGHSGNVNAIALSPDGRRLATGGDDRVIRVFDVTTGKELHRFAGHTDMVTCRRRRRRGR